MKTQIVKFISDFIANCYRITNLTALIYCKQMILSYLMYCACIVHQIAVRIVKLPNLFQILLQIVTELTI